MEFPASLLNRAEQIAPGVNRSDLIRKAVEQFVETAEKERLERELAEGYVANAEQARRSCEELSFLESDFI